MSDVPRSFAKTLSKGDAVELSVKGVSEVLGNPVASFSAECARISHAAAEQAEQKKGSAAAEKRTKQAEATVAAPSKSKPAKSQSKRRLELPCRPGQRPPCYD